MKPRISVIMGIYNCAPTLQEALNCLYAQTYQDFEIILCDDGSKDDTYAIAQENAQKYSNIKLIKNPHNMGLNQTLNNCLAVAKGEFIARMDGDDTCSPNRFEKEMKVLDEHPEYAIVSTDMSFFDENGTWGQTNELSEPQPQDFLKKTQFCHAACLVRKEAYDAVEGYSVDNKLLRVEDYHLWVKMYSKGYRGYNILEPLYQMRDDRNANNRKKFKFRFNEAYVKAEAIRLFHLPLWSYIYCFRPIIIGLLPNPLYNYLHHKK
ncbi:glycosyltransferase family 2 protein [Bacteroides acidifaciens]|uniref:glycosyltransferase family 2 protein n=1 Tax=Bacteroides acidifaciens TaxID=85831 RepID=UPI002585B005|nr:glycosyltransferase [Bacteroides acidifaciens]